MKEIANKFVNVRDGCLFQKVERKENQRSEENHTNMTVKEELFANMCLQHVTLNSVYR